MRKQLLAALLMLVSFTPAYSQDPKERTLATSLPITDNSWAYYGSIKGKEPPTQFWLYTKDIKYNTTIISVWYRYYDYKDKIITLAKERLNRVEKTKQLLSLRVYDMTTNETKFSQEYENEPFKTTPPGSSADLLFDTIDELEKEEKIKKNKK